MAIIRIKPARLEFYDNKTTKYSGSKVLEVTGADIVFNASLFKMDSTLAPLCDVKINGQIVSDEKDISYRGFAWNNGDARAVHAVSGGNGLAGVSNYDNFVSCLMLSTAEHGKLTLPTASVNNLDGYNKRARTAFGYTLDGTMVILCGTGTTGYTIAEVQNLLYDTEKCLDSINLDGGGSSQLYSKNDQYGKVTSSRTVSNYICVWVAPPDTTAPIIESITSPLNNQQLSLGDTFYFQVKVEDESDIAAASCSFTATDGSTLSYSNYTYNESNKTITFTLDSITKDWHPQTWSLKTLTVSDTENNTKTLNDIDTSSMAISFSVEDVRDPIIKKVTSEQNEQILKAGDKIIINVELEEDSGIFEAGAFFENQNSTRLFSTRIFNYDQSTKICQIEITIDDNWETDEYYLKEVYITDSSLNKGVIEYLDPNADRLIFFTQDSKAPSVLSITCDKSTQVITRDDEILITIFAEDKSLIVEGYLELINGEFVYNKRLVGYNANTGFTFRIKPESSWPSGKYTVNNVRITDEYQNKAELENTNIWFIIQDSDAPIIKNITSEQIGAVLSTGETFNFNIEIEEESDIVDVKAVFEFVDSPAIKYTLSDYYYSKDLKTIVASVTMDEEDFPGKWMLTSVSITDNNSNTTTADVSQYGIYFYSNDETDYEAPILDFVYMENSCYKFTSRTDPVQYVFVKYQDVSPIAHGQLCFKTFEGAAINVEDFSLTNQSDVIAFAINPNKFPENIADGHYFLEIVTLSDTFDNCSITKNSDGIDYQMGIANFQVDFQPDPEPEEPDEPTPGPDPDPPTPPDPDEPEPPAVTPDPIFVALKGKKILQSNDMTLSEGQFEFRLLQNNIALQSKTNMIDGTISFDGIQFAEPTESYYLIQEMGGTVEGMIYDAMIYQIRIIVTESNNKLIADVAIMDAVGNKINDIVFTNIYKKPAEPEPPAPDEPDEPEPPEPDVKRILIREPTFGYGSFWMRTVE